MKKNKDLFQRIKDNEHKLTEQPSPRAWSRLEDKLEKQRSRRSLSVVRTWVMAAVITLLIGFLFLISNMVSPKIADEIALDASPEKFEDLDYPDKAVEPYRVLVSYREKMSQNTSIDQPIINEGKGKRLVLINGKPKSPSKKFPTKDSLNRDSIKM